MGGVQPPKTLFFLLREFFGTLLGSPPPLDVAMISTSVAQLDNPLCGCVCVASGICGLACGLPQGPITRL